MLKPYLQLLMDKPYLIKEEAEAAMEAILKGADACQIAALLAILKYRGERPEELAGMAQALKKKRVSVNPPFPVLDIVGTGGDFANTVNISTGASLLAAACGIPVAKHGNRSVSSASGSADVLEALDVEIELSPDEVVACLEEVGIAFMFAPAYNPSLKTLGPIRRALKFPTVFNLLGPLLNPARAEYALIGVAHESLVSLMSQALILFGSKKRALVFHGSGLDELTTLGKVTACHIQEGIVSHFEIDPISLGFSICSLKELQGGSAQVNATILQEAFAGKEGAVTDALIFNAGAALWIFGQASSLIEGVEIARKVQREGATLKLLEKWKIVSKKVKRRKDDLT